MKILPISDIHTELHPDRGVNFAMSLPNDNVDVLILAGDIGNLKTLPMVLRIFSHRFKDVVFVPGNNEFYGSVISEALYELEEICNRYSNVHFLSEDSIKIDEFEIFGSTLWFSEPMYTLLSKEIFKKFDQIKPDYGSSSSLEDIYIENIQAMFFLSSVPMSEKSIVVTHYLPLMDSLTQDFKSNPLNFLHYTDLSNLISQKSPALWVHGHTHESLDYTFVKTRVLCNPLGYFPSGPLNPCFKKDLLIDV